jgi:hypothetical protein
MKYTEYVEGLGIWDCNGAVREYDQIIFQMAAKMPVGCCRRPENYHLLGIIPPVSNINTNMNE